MANDVTLTIDNHQVTVPAGTLVVDAAKLVDVDIPVFCYHPKMEPVGMCRMCLVEVGTPMRDRATGELMLEEDGSPKINWGRGMQTGCTVVVSEGMVVRGYTEEVKEARDNVLEFILTSHPLDCPICDKGGECPLQNLTMRFGPSNTRFVFGEKIDLAKNVPLGDLIYLDRERCIQCARCTRFQSEIADDPVIGFFNRGRRLEIVTFSDPGFDSYFSGNTTDICPVGALTTADFRFGARPWELNQAASLSPHTAVGANITLNTRREAKTGGSFVIKRVMPRQNESVNEIWISDKTRFGYHYTQHEDRLTQPMIRKNGKLVPADWGEALDLVASKLKDAGENLFTLAGGMLSNEDLYSLKTLTEHQGGSIALASEMAGGDLTAQAGVGKGTNLGALGKGDAVLVVACDLEEEAPIWWLRVKQAAERGTTLIVANPRETKLDRYAAHSIRYAYGKESDLETNLGAGAVQAFTEAENAVVFFGAEGVGLDGSAALAQACANFAVKTGHVGKPNNGIIGVWDKANTQGAWDIGLRPTADLGAALSNASALYLVAADPVGDDSALESAVENADFVVVQELFLTETAKLADVVFPASAMTEREGSMTSGERRVQRYYIGIPAVGQSRPDFTITAQIAQRLDMEMEGRLAARVFKALADETPAYDGLTFIHLAQTEIQFPIVGGEDLYYGGTSYNNSQGLGVQVATTADNGETVSVEDVSVPSVDAGDGLLAVPVTRLYDLGTTIVKSDTLAPRLPKPYVVLHPADAGTMGVDDGAKVNLKLNGQTYLVRARYDETMPQGVVLVPRSMGMPITAPVGVEVTAAEMVIA